MTYRQLKWRLSTLTEEQLDTEITIRQDNNELVSARFCSNAWSAPSIGDRLDDDHPVFLVNLED